jgi:multiple sugar transport system ATP-binding protein
MGSEIVLYSKVDDQDFVARVDARFNATAGQTIDFAFNLSKAHFFDKETEERIK